MMIYLIFIDLIEIVGDSCCIVLVILVFYGCLCLILSKVDKFERYVFLDVFERVIVVFVFVKDLKLENMVLFWGR